MDKKQRRLVASRVGWVLIALGLASAIAGVFMLANSVGPALKDTFLRHACATPCSETRQFDAGRYLVFEQTGRSTSVGPVTSTRQDSTTIQPTDVAITSPTGQPLAVTATSSSETINRNGAIYVSVVSFHVPESGRYQVEVGAPGETQVLIAPGIGQTFTDALPGAGVAALALTVGATGVVILILDWVRRRPEATTP